MGKASISIRNTAQAIAEELGVKPSRTVKALQSLTMPRDMAPRKGSEGRRPPVIVPEIPTFERVVTPTPSWVYVETSARWGVVMENEGRIFVASAEPDADGQIDLTTLPKGKVVGVCGFWKYNDHRFPSVNWKLASYGLKPWEVALGVTTDWAPELDIVWYVEADACSVSFWF
jgi:hypothetical protein